MKHFSVYPPCCPLGQFAGAFPPRLRARSFWQTLDSRSCPGRRQPAAAKSPRSAFSLASSPICFSQDFAPSCLASAFSLKTPRMVVLARDFSEKFAASRARPCCFGKIFPPKLRARLSRLTNVSRGTFRVRFVAHGNRRMKNYPLGISRRRANSLFFVSRETFLAQAKVQAPPTAWLANSRASSKAFAKATLISDDQSASRLAMFYGKRPNVSRETLPKTRAKYRRRFSECFFASALRHRQPCHLRRGVAANAGLISAVLDFRLCTNVNPAFAFGIFFQFWRCQLYHGIAAATGRENCLETF